MADEVFFGPPQRNITAGARIPRNRPYHVVDEGTTDIPDEDVPPRGPRSRHGRASLHCPHQGQRVLHRAAASAARYPVEHLPGYMGAGLGSICPPYDRFNSHKTPAEHSPIHGRLAGFSRPLFSLAPHHAGSPAAPTLANAHAS